MISTPRHPARHSLIRFVPLVTAGPLLFFLLLVVTACQTQPAPGPEHSPPGVSIQLTGPRRVLPEWNDIDLATWSGRNAIAFTTRAGGVYRADLTTDHQPIRMSGLDSVALNLAADPNGRVVAANSLDKLVAWTSDGEVVVQDNTLGLVGASALAIDDAGRQLVLGSFSLDVFQLDPYRRVSSGRQPEPSRVGYSSLVFAGNRVVGDSDNLDVWDVSGNAAVLTRHDCRCDGQRVVVDPASRLAVFATRTGHVILWDINQARAIADRTLITSPEQFIEPFAVVADRLVLFSVNHPVPGGQPLSGPLQAWDTATNTVIKVWDCPGCEVRQIIRRPDNHLLIYTVTSNEHLTALWTAVLRH